MNRISSTNSFIHINDKPNNTLHSISFADLDATRRFLGGEIITALHLKSVMLSKVKLIDGHKICIIFDYKYLNDDQPLDELSWKFGMGYLCWEPIDKK